MKKKHKYFISTNPPYLAKNSCYRKKYTQTYKDYFKTSNFDDLYLLALSKMISTNQPGFAIVPETFINSKFDKTNVNRIIIIEPNPFEDTTVPICIVCFNGTKLEKQIIYKNDDKIGSLQELKKLKIFVKEKSEFLKKLRFNDVNGFIALLGVDSTNPEKKIKFIHKNKLKYNISNIKTSSRAITIVNSEEFKYLDDSKIEKIIINANQILNIFRTQTKDVLLSPFKGNNKDNQRRRRLDFHLARNILTKAFIDCCNNINEDSIYEKDINYKTKYKEQLKQNLENFNIKDKKTLNKIKKFCEKFNFIQEEVETSIKHNNINYLLECSFFNTSGSKINSELKRLVEFSKTINKFKNIQFIYVIEGPGLKKNTSLLEKTLTETNVLFNIHRFQEFLKKIKQNCIF
ncbi:hypothetical protein HGD80_01170 [Paulownia witches'-broom phytoplasma]|uniref:Restriction endonuclease type II DpnII-like domain-containing protein n=1 Tax=Paulownia witches'-broom phytoplasma TaxID=39647 RepID=A0ABX8TPW4_9MOLU|nr:DpnII family type II restriction endonuclease [Paulownia witches'-broom phytoplasma]QYC31207.1 hypothetical protein HGD80_01170 [Paulownia witches'-broom phytoplasma]